MSELKWYPNLDDPYVLLWDGREIARIENHEVTFMQFSTMYKQIPIGVYSDPKVPRRLLDIARKTLRIGEDRIKANSSRTDIVSKIIQYCRKKGIRIYRHYSGRGMFGKKCIAFSGTNNECITIAEFIKRKTGQSYCYDNLGLNMIYYFPNIED